MDLVIILILIAIICFFFRDYKHAVYFLGIIEILFRLIHFAKVHLKIDALTKLVDKYIPTSLFDIIAKYSTGLLYDILIWLLFACFVSWLVYLVRYFFKK